MPSEIRGKERKKIHLKIKQEDVKDVLLILQSYSCTNYTVTTGCCCSLETKLDVPCTEDHEDMSVSISAQCVTDYIPFLLDELRAALGKQIDIEVEKFSSG